MCVVFYDDIMRVRDDIPVHTNYHNLNFVNWTCFLWVYCIFVATSAIIFRFEFVNSSA